VFTARYALSPYIKQIRFVFKGSISSAFRDFRLPPRRWWDLRSSGILCSVEWLSFTDVSGRRIAPIFKGKDVLFFFLEFLTSEEGTHTSSRNVGKKITIRRCVISQMSVHLIINLNLVGRYFVASLEFNDNVNPLWLLPHWWGQCAMCVRSGKVSQVHFMQKHKF
jgi:hypothetical protein